MRSKDSRGFTLVEVLVALMIVAMGLAALMTAVSSTARASGYLRDKTLAQWIALNRLTEVRLNSSNKFAQNIDAADVDFAARTWHYDTRYFDTSIATMKRVVVRVYAGNAKTKGNPVAESTTFIGTALGTRGASNQVWALGAVPPTGDVPGGAGTTIGTPTSTTPTPTTTPNPNPITTPQ
jgi:general secretion pathway protein I